MYREQSRTPMRVVDQIIFDYRPLYISTTMGPKKILTWKVMLTIHMTSLTMTWAQPCRVATWVSKNAEIRFVLQSERDWTKLIP